MTINELAKVLGISARTLYRRAEKAAINVSELRDDGGKLTAEGASVLASLFDNDRDTKKERHTDDTPSMTQDVTEPDADLMEAYATIDALTHENNALKRENDLLKQMLETAQQNAEGWQRQAERAQQLHAMEMQKLLPEKAGIWQRIRKAFTTGKKEAEE